MEEFKKDHLQTMISKILEELDNFYDVVEYEELLQEAWLYVLEHPLKTNIENSLYNRLKYLIRKEILHRSLMEFYNDDKLYELNSIGEYNEKSEL